MQLWEAVKALHEDKKVRCKERIAENFWVVQIDGI